MNVIKRNGSEVVFDINKISTAIHKANDEVSHKLTDRQIRIISENIRDEAEKLNRALDVEEIQDMVEREIVRLGNYELAKAYIVYRYTRALESGRDNGIIKRVLSIVQLENEEILQENSNKNPIINSTQRDYIAGEVSKEIARNVIYDKDVIKAHDEGLIHKHDMDYMVQKMNNCGLVALDDMLQNSTVISDVLIETPHRFPTATNISTQAVSQIASSQYGGQSISVAHLTPFVDVSRKYITKQVEKEFSGLPVTQEYKDKVIKDRLQDHIRDGVQTIQYQIITLMTTNGWC